MGHVARRGLRCLHVLLDRSFEEGLMHTNLELGLYVFLLATFVGLEVIRRVSPLLHTPLMSLTNAISAIAVVGSLVIAGRGGQPAFITTLGTIAVAASMVNVVGGYMITYRMVVMFKQRGPKKP